jgi:ribosomal protein S14
MEEEGNQAPMMRFELCRNCFHEHFAFIKK